MELRDRILGPIASGDTEHALPTVDFGDLVRKLIVADRLILESHFLGEFPVMVQKFGFDGVAELMLSGRLRIHCEALTMLETGRIPEVRQEKGVLSPGSYSFTWLSLEERRKHMSTWLKRLNDAPGLSPDQAKRLRSLVGNQITDPPADSGSQGAQWLNEDLVANADLLKPAIALAASRELQRSVDPAAVELRVEQIAPGDFRTETNLATLLGLPPGDVHELVGTGLLCAGGANIRLELMKRYNAVTGFKPDEAPLFDAKFGEAVRRLDPDAETAQLERVLVLAGLPDVASDANESDVDLPRLLEILQTQEALEFRAWLRGADQLTDSEMRYQVGRMQEMIRKVVHSPVTKVIRWSAVTAAGVVVKVPEVGVAVSAADAFLIDRFVAKPGRLAFLSELYPTVFSPK